MPPGWPASTTMILDLPRQYDTLLGPGGVGLVGPASGSGSGLPRALLGARRCVVLDEPNANLDATGEQALKEALLHLQGPGRDDHRGAHPPLHHPRDRRLMMFLRTGTARQFGPPGESIKPCNRRPRGARHRRPLRPGFFLRARHRAFYARPATAGALFGAWPSLAAFAAAP